jgi:hypothetical protein
MSSTAEAVAAIGSARNVEVLAYTLRPGAVLGALEAAARRGARVTVRLEGAPYNDRGGALARLNGRVVAELARAGADAKLAHAGRNGAAEAPLHAKAIVAGDALFLDDRNWGATDFVIRDGDPSDARRIERAVGDDKEPCAGALAVRKRDALAQEAAMLRAAHPAGDVIVESESFGFGNAVYGALDVLAKSGAAPRLLVSSREAKNPREASALRKLASDGVRVRTCDDSEKFALAGSGAWIGSANASPAFGYPDTIDWGLRTSARAIVEAARARVEARWAGGKPLPPAPPAPAASRPTAACCSRSFC